MEAEEAGRVPGGVASDVVDDGAGAKDGSLREEDVVAEVPEGADLDAGPACEATAGNVSATPTSSGSCRRQLLL